MGYETRLWEFRSLIDGIIRGHAMEIGLFSSAWEFYINKKKLTRERQKDETLLQVLVYGIYPKRLT